MKIKQICVLLPVIAGLLVILLYFCLLGTQREKIDVTSVNDVAKTLEEKGADSEEASSKAALYGLSYLYVDGTIFVYQVQNQKENLVRAFWICTAVVMICSIATSLLLVYLDQRVIRPFQSLKVFARRVAAGNLDAPLLMDKNHVFGAFTESFDLMREELKRARENEKAANESKKELVACISHDIKTPLASVKAMAELLDVKSEEDWQKQKLQAIEYKTEQIQLLIDNLFHATLEELQELSIHTEEKFSTEIEKLIHNADYENRIGKIEIPECLVQFDPLRLQQIFDNILGNSYKYADTKIEVESILTEEYLTIAFQDFGNGVPKEELVLLRKKYYRGSNSSGKGGTGIGLFLTDYLVKEMGGYLELPETECGFRVEIGLKVL